MFVGELCGLPQTKVFQDLLFDLPMAGADEIRLTASLSGRAFGLLATPEAPGPTTTSWQSEGDARWVIAPPGGLYTRPARPRSKSSGLHRCLLSDSRPQVLL
jgi:hypothetical protein